MKLVVQLMKLVHLWIPSALWYFCLLGCFNFATKTHVGLLPPSFAVHCHFDQQIAHTVNQCYTYYNRCVGCDRSKHAAMLVPRKPGPFRRRTFLNSCRRISRRRPTTFMKCSRRTSTRFSSTRRISSVLRKHIKSSWLFAVLPPISQTWPRSFSLRSWLIWDQKLVWVKGFLKALRELGLLHCCTAQSCAFQSLVHLMAKRMTFFLGIKGKGNKLHFKMLLTNTFRWRANQGTSCHTGIYYGPSETTTTQSIQFITMHKIRTDRCP